MDISVRRKPVDFGQQASEAPPEQAIALEPVTSAQAPLEDGAAAMQLPFQMPFAPAVAAAAMSPIVAPAGAQIAVAMPPVNASPFLQDPPPPSAPATPFTRPPVLVQNDVWADVWGAGEFTAAKANLAAEEEIYIQPIRRASTWIMSALCFLMVTASYALYVKWDSGIWPLETEIRAALGGDFSFAFAPSAPKVRAKQQTKTAAAAPLAPATPYPENPYWHLANGLIGPREPLKRPWTVEEEDELRGGLESEHYYQHYRSVQEARQRRLAGAEDILWQGLSERRLWTRMNALIGLAEYGTHFNLDTVEQALGKAPQYLIGNYFKRFSTRTDLSGGELFVLRASIRFVAVRARLAIVTALAKNPDALLDQYLVAASYDPDEKVRYLAQYHLLDHQPENLATLKAAIHAPLPVANAKAADGTATPEIAPAAVPKAMGAVTFYDQE